MASFPVNFPELPPAGTRHVLTGRLHCQIPFAPIGYAGGAISMLAQTQPSGISLECGRFNCAKQTSLLRTGIRPGFRAYESAGY